MNKTVNIVSLVTEVNMIWKETNLKGVFTWAFEDRDESVEVGIDLTVGTQVVRLANLELKNKKCLPRYMTLSHDVSIHITFGHKNLYSYDRFFFCAFLIYERTIKLGYNEVSGTKIVC